MDKTLLIVSDDRQERETITSGIRQGRFEALQAGSAFEGMACFRELRPSIALVNFEMPGGRELIESIISESPTVQVIVLCSTRNMDRAMEALTTSSADFLLRPFREVVLAAGPRTENVVSLQTRLKQTMDNLTTLSEQKAAEMVDTERFLAIRQIVDRMSALSAKSPTMFTAA